MLLILVMWIINEPKLVCTKQITVYGVNWATLVRHHISVWIKHLQSIAQYKQGTETLTGRSKAALCTI